MKSWRIYKTVHLVRMCFRCVFFSLLLSPSVNSTLSLSLSLTQIRTRYFLRIHILVSVSITFFSFSESIDYVMCLECERNEWRGEGNIEGDFSWVFKHLLASRIYRIGGRWRRVWGVCARLLNFLLLKSPHFLLLVFRFILCSFGMWDWLMTPPIANSFGVCFVLVTEECHLNFVEKLLFVGFSVWFHGSVIHSFT